ncbi:MAG: carboxypeptidase regulatory-like domain-containing protein [Pirellulales bacterium]|nr:carboxypeptidase regulatory-like domain-containing protein [Pirellulales bacterium]
MILQILALTACLTLADAPAENRGVISGVVVNASQGNSPVEGCTVVLRVRSENQFVVFGETAADRWGRFRFENLPVGKYYEYLPGANRGDVHYPGPRVRITPAEPHAAVELSVCDSIAAPSPLVLARHDIRLRTEPGVLYVTESLVVENPSSTCYIGQAEGEDAVPVTLQLNIPPEFERATFDQEYFGSRFGASEGKLITGIPWPPGKKEVKFTYVIRNDETNRNWRRPLDLPCSDVCVRVQSARPEEVACNLSPAPIEKRGKDEKGEIGEVLFRSEGKLLPAGFVIDVSMGHLPVPWMAYARWTALTVLFGIAAGAGIFALRRRKSPPPPISAQNRGPISTPTKHRSKHPSAHGPHRSKGDRRKRRHSR